MEIYLHSLNMKCETWNPVSLCGDLLFMLAKNCCSMEKDLQKVLK